MLFTSSIADTALSIKLVTNLVYAVVTIWGYANTLVIPL